MQLCFAFSHVPHCTPPSSDLANSSVVKRLDCSPSVGTLTNNSTTTRHGLTLEWIHPHRHVTLPANNKRGSCSKPRLISESLLVSKVILWKLIGKSLLRHSLCNNIVSYRKAEVTLPFGRTC